MLSAKGLVAGYRQLEVLHGVNLELAPGETLALLGANGAGKTTFCRVVSGQVGLKRGRLELDGVNITASSSAERVRLGVVQVPEGRQVFPEMTVAENLRLGAFVHGGPRADDIDKVFELFPILKARYGQWAGHLSGGEQQMLALGRAIMARPRYLLLDEPSQGVAPKVVEQMGEAIKQIASEGVAILLVEQNLFLAELICDHAYILENGSCAGRGEMAGLVSSSEIQQSYLGG